MKRKKRPVAPPPVPPFSAFDARSLVGEHVLLPAIEIEGIRFRPELNEKTDLRSIIKAYYAWGVRLSLVFGPSTAGPLPKGTPVPQEEHP